MKKILFIILPLIFFQINCKQNVSGPDSEKKPVIEIWRDTEKINFNFIVNIEQQNILNFIADTNYLFIPASKIYLYDSLKKEYSGGSYGFNNNIFFTDTVVNKKLTYKWKQVDNDSIFAIVNISF